MFYDLGMERSPLPVPSFPPSDEYMDVYEARDPNPGILAAKAPRCGGNPGAKAGGYPR